MTVAVSSTRIHHLIFSQSTALRRKGDVLVPAFIDGALRPYGELVPGTVVVLPEQAGAPQEMMVKLNGCLTPRLWPGLTRGGALRRSVVYVRARREVEDLVKRADFVMLYLPNTLGLIAGVAAVRAGVPVYIDLAGTLRAPRAASAAPGLRTRIAGRLFSYRAERRLAAHARLIVAVNPHLFETFPPSPAPKVVITHSTITADAIHVRNDSCTHPTVTLFVAAMLRESKGIQHLIEVLGVLTEDSWDVHLKIAGIGAYMDALKRMTAVRGLQGRVTFLGGVPNGPQLWRYYREADICVLPSLGYYEGSPRMIIESWAAGAPVIASAVGGIPHLMCHEVDGLLVPPGDVPALVAAIKRIRSDASLRDRVISEGYRRARDMTYEGRVRLLREAFSKYLPGLLPEDGPCPDRK